MKSYTIKWKGRVRKISGILERKKIPRGQGGRGRQKWKTSESERRLVIGQVEGWKEGSLGFHLSEWEMPFSMNSPPPLTMIMPPLMVSPFWELDPKIVQRSNPPSLNSAMINCAAGFLFSCSWFYYSWSFPLGSGTRRWAPLAIMKEGRSEEKLPLT